MSAGDPEDEASVDHVTGVERAFLDAEVEAALQLASKGLSKEEREWMRARLVELVATDPNGVALLRAATPRSVDQSGEVVRGDAGRGQTKAG